MASEAFERVALVTGAARGIGAATVEALCRAGYGVAAIDACAGATTPAGVTYPLAHPADLDRIADSHKNRVLQLTCDVRDPVGLAAAVAQTLDRFGRLDAVVAAAGIISGGRALWETPIAELRALIDVNLVGVWNTAVAAVPAMLSGPDPSGCRLVVIASAAGERGLFHLAGYAASKHGVIGLARGLAEDLAGTGITAVAVAPGSTRTTMLAATADLYGTTTEELASHQAIKRVIEPEEIAAVVAFCCSREAASLNGSVVRADGGFRA